MTVTRRAAKMGFLAFVAALPALEPALAQDAARGRDYVLRNCTQCHVVDSNQKSASDIGPPFATIAAMPSVTAASLRVFLSSPHARMPDLILSSQQIRDVSAYILSLQK